MPFIDAKGRPELVVNRSIKLGLAFFKPVPAPDRADSQIATGAIPATESPVRRAPRRRAQAADRRGLTHSTKREPRMPDTGKRSSRQAVTKSPSGVDEGRARPNGDLRAGRTPVRKRKAGDDPVG